MVRSVVFGSSKVPSCADKLPRSNRVHSVRDAVLGETIYHAQSS
jgi:hypothetical protein